MIRVRKVNEEKRTMTREEQMQMSIRDAEFVRDATKYLADKYQDLAHFDVELSIILERLLVLSAQADMYYKRLSRQARAAQKNSSVLQVLQLRLAFSKEEA